jgi:hypothetical protein
VAGNTDFKGVICVYGSWTIKDSVFYNSSVVRIAGQYATGSPFSLTFEDCYFDEYLGSSQGMVIIEPPSLACWPETL